MEYGLYHRDLWEWRCGLSRIELYTIMTMTIIILQCITVLLYIYSETLAIRVLR